MAATNLSPWHRLIKKADKDAEFGAPAPGSHLEAVEQALGIPLPVTLRELLSEFNGVKAHYSAEIIWPVLKIQEQNLRFRSDEGFKRLYMPFNHVLFFGNDGGGDHFGFAIHADGQIHKRDIFRWKHESDERVWAANNLQVFFERKAFK